MTGRALRIELLRGAAPVAAGGALLGGLVEMYSLAGGWAGWPGRWMPFATSIRMTLFVVGGLTVACAAWQGGRERRRRMEDQLASSARPGWQPVLVSWAAVTLGASVVLLAVVIAGAALVAPVATYSAGGWWWVLAVAFPGLAALSALGFAFGRLVPFRLAAPVAGIGAYLIMVGAIDTVELGGVRWLAPVLSQYDAPGFQFSGAVSAQQTLWFGGLAVTALVLVGARRRWLAIVPAGSAAVAATLLITDPVDPWQPDPRALELVCTDRTPEVCLTRLNAFLLDDAARAVEPVLARWDGVPGAPTRAVEENFVLYSLAPDPTPPGGSVFRVRLDSGVTLTGGLAEPYEDLPYVDWWPHIECDEGAGRTRHESVFRVTAAWGSNQKPSWFEPSERAALEVLEGMPDDAQGAWLGAAVAAAETCDEATLAKLAEDLE
jgi:hypothetical protein